MPYIATEDREAIEPVLQDFARDIRDRLADDTFFKAGTLAYIVYRLMTMFADRSTMFTFEKVRWRDHARVWADVVLGGAAYYKRDCIDPYEAGAEDLNGSITVGWGDDFLYGEPIAPPPIPEWSGDDPDDEIPF